MFFFLDENEKGGKNELEKYVCDVFIFLPPSLPLSRLHNVICLCELLLLLLFFVLF